MRRSEKNFAVEEGVLRISGDGAGYVATELAYKNYRVHVEYKWGRKADRSGVVRNSDVLLHKVGAYQSADVMAWSGDLAATRADLVTTRAVRTQRGRAAINSPPCFRPASQLPSTARRCVGFSAWDVV